MSSISRQAACALGFAWLSLTRAAGAAPCGRPDIDLTFPPQRAAAVPSNAVFSAHYGSPARYDDEPVSLTDPAGNAVTVTVAYDAAESLLRATPDRPLSEGLHQLEWPGLRGVADGSVGRGSTTDFSVQATLDAAPPRFEGLLGVEWDLARERDPCLDRLDDRFVFRLTLGAASDDAGSDLLSLIVFETRDPTAAESAEPNQVARRAFPAAARRVEVRRPASKSGRTCFAAVAQDLLGNVSGGGDVQVCAEPKEPPFFDGCALRGAGPQGAGGAWYFLAALALRRLRRGRGTHARSHRVA